MAPVAHDCAGALLLRDGRVLLGRRAPDRAWLPDAWDLFGGHLEPGESAEQAMQRELAEELGVRALRWRALDVLESAASGGWRLRVFAVDHFEGEPRNLQATEHAVIEWCTPAQALARLGAVHPGFAGVLAQAFDGAG
jgi:8-oxo-dGTP diphosphatase